MGSSIAELPQNMKFTLNSRINKAGKHVCLKELEEVI